jgi:Fic family protein
MGSNTIEGYTVSLGDAESVVAGAEVAAESGDAALAAVAGYHEALTFVQQSSHIESFAYQEMLLSALHFMMLRHRLDMWPGRYRRGPILVTGGRGRPPAYVGPEADQVPGLMAELVAWLQDGDTGGTPLYVRAAMAHLNLVSIHPWRDGNGRMSRCLHTLVLARDQVLAPEFSSIEEWLGMSTVNTAEYYTALSQAQGGAYLPDRDTHAWVRFCLRAHHLQAQLVDQRVRAAAALWDTAARLASEFGLHERTAIALFAAAEGTLRRSTYAADEQLTRDQALRDLNLLQRLQLIQPSGAGVRRHYLATGRWRDAVRELQQDTELLHEPYR